MRALSIFIKRSNRSVMSWVHRFGGLSGALHVGRARKAVVDERSVRVRGEEAWIWMALETRSRRPLAPEPSWTRSSPTAYLVGTTLLVSNSSIATLDGRNVTFVGGGVSGGASWKMGIGYSTEALYSIGGGVPGAGRVVVYDNSGNLLGQFALPLNVKLKFQNVGRIELYVEVPILAMEWTLMNYGMYSAFIVASVYYWVE
jgi:hypothetical protein